MGVNLVPIVRQFQIDTRFFSAGSCAVAEGCVVPGMRKLLRFDFLCWNAGDADLSIGSPAAHPEWYEFSPCHGHYHLKDFNGYKLFDCSGREVTGNKQAFCMIDIERLSGGPASPQFQDCNNDQGISAGWADVYHRGLDCQWIDVTGLPDGDYVLEARTNRTGLLGEDWYGDNFTWAGVRLAGAAVTQLPVPCYPEDCLGFDPGNVQAVNIGGRWKVVDGSHWILDFGASQANAQKARDIIKHYGMNEICFVGRPSPTGQQLMMYFKVNGAAPAGAFPGEDAIPFNPANVVAQQAGGRWKVTEGSMWMLDFGVSEANARKAAAIIREYGFSYQCFVGRPGAPMMYFRTAGKGKETKEKEKEKEKDLKEKDPKDLKDRKETMKEKEALKERDELAAPTGEDPAELLGSLAERIEQLEQRLAAGRAFIGSPERPDVGTEALSEREAPGEQPAPLSLDEPQPIEETEQQEEGG
jgi:Lysyl oxidase